MVLTEIRGLVRRWHARVVLDPDQLARSSIDVVVDAGSLETGVIERDNHIRSAEFLNISEFPEIRFRSQEVQPGKGRDRYIIRGELTIRNVTREVRVLAERQRLPDDGAPGSKMVFLAHALVNRQDFGLSWNQDFDRGGVVAGDVVDLRVSVTARQPATRA
jgi:polyisoprenoid-binding protein YceI